MGRRFNYDKRPVIPTGAESACHVGWAAITERLEGLKTRDRCVLVVECYPGVRVDEVRQAFTEGLSPALVVDARQAYKHSHAVETLCAPYLGDDPVFGRMNGLGLGDFLDRGRQASLRGRIEKSRQGLALVVGAGASLLVEPDVLVYADMARWEIQQRQRRSEPTAIAVADHAESPSLQYKRGFFIDWRAADRQKRRLLPTLDYLLDTNDPERPKLIDGDDFRAGLARAARQPFRVVPFFDPGPWGGQ